MTHMNTERTVRIAIRIAQANERLAHLTKVQTIWITSAGCINSVIDDRMRFTRARIAMLCHAMHNA